MSKKDREGGMSKRQEFREKRRREEQRGRWIWIGVIIIGVLLVAFFIIAPMLKPVASVTPVTPRSRPQVNRNSTGDPNAPVKLTEFSDFQCPYCKHFWSDTEAQVIDAYVKTGKVQFTYRSAGNWVSRNSGSGGFESQNAAMGAYCAGDQNKFWDMHDALFTNNGDVEEQGSFEPRRVQAIAQSIGLDMTTFNTCYSSNKYLNQLTTDYNDAIAAGIQGTPFFLVTYTVNGQTQTDKIDGAQPFSAFQTEFDKALAAMGK